MAKLSGDRDRGALWHVDHGMEGRELGLVLSESNRFCIPIGALGAGCSALNGALEAPNDRTTTGDLTGENSFNLDVLRILADIGQLECQGTNLSVLNENLRGSKRRIDGGNTLFLQLIESLNILLIALQLSN